MQFWLHLQHDDKTKELFMMASGTLKTIAFERADLDWKHYNRLI